MCSRGQSQEKRKEMTNNQQLRHMYNQKQRSTRVARAISI